MATSTIKGEIFTRFTNSTTTELPVTIASGGSKKFDFSVKRNGYIPISITGIWGSGNGKCGLPEVSLGTETAYLYYNNPTSAGLTISALFIETLQKFVGG